MLSRLEVYEEGWLGYRDVWPNLAQRLQEEWDKVHSHESFCAPNFAKFEWITGAAGQE